MNKILFSIVAASAMISSQVLASQYAVQLEASKSPDIKRFQALSVYGKLYTVTAENGYVRTRLGPYDSKGKALDVLEQVHQAGYTDAFLAKQKPGKANSPLVSSAVPNKRTHKYDIETLDVKTLKEWKMLTPEQQANLVYLDGELHVKNGSRFIPLSEITGTK